MYGSCQQLATDYYNVTVIPVVLVMIHSFMIAPHHHLLCCVNTGIQNTTRIFMTAATQTEAGLSLQQDKRPTTRLYLLLCLQAPP